MVARLVESGMDWATPTSEYRRTAIRYPDELTTGLDALLFRGYGWCKRRAAVKTRLRLAANRIDVASEVYREYTDGRLRERTEVLKQEFRRCPEQSDAVVEDAFACLREAAERTTGLRPYKVQLMGALGLYRGYLTEMATGEGKTLVAAMAATIAGWSRLPCHVITVNDYLAQRDAETFEKLYRFCGVTVGYVVGHMKPERRRESYDCDVTYATSKEVLADFLRDRLRLGHLQDARRRNIAISRLGISSISDGLVMRGLHTAIVDEADSVLIDEAVTPLIISKPGENKPLVAAYETAMEIANQLEEGKDFTVNQRYKEVEWTDDGKERVGELNPRIPGLWRATSRWLELVLQSLQARYFFLPDEQYVLHEEKVVIVDEFSGRMMPLRTWRHGLHQAIEAKEGAEISPPSETLSRLSFQRFFRLYHKLSGMTGTAIESAAEFWHVYELPVVQIPPNRPCRRKMRRDRIFADAESKWEAVVAEIKRLHAQGAPVLVGTRSVADSERLATMLENEDLSFNLLNAVHHAEEARIVAEAGILNKITIATNMAGRGTDIRIDDEVEELGGLHVIATERHESGRIDRQLFGRSARQGNFGAARAYLSVEDALFVRFAWGRGATKVLKLALHCRLPGAGLAAGLLTRQCQAVAQRQAFRQRQAVLKTDAWMDDALSFVVGADGLVQ